MIVNLEDAIKYANRFMGKDQRAMMKSGLVGEEMSYFSEKYLEIANNIKNSPVTYEQKDVADPIAHLHYFCGSSDWFILEKDKIDGVTQTFGFSCLNGDTACAELGYISIKEIVDVGAELDFHFDKMPLSQCKTHLAAAQAA